MITRPSVASLKLSDIASTTFPTYVQAFTARTYQDAAGEREVVELVRVTGTPSPVKAGHVVDLGGTYWRINAKAAKATFFADMNGSAAGIRAALQSALDMVAAFPGMTGSRVEFPSGTFDMSDVTLTISAKTILTAPYGDCILQRSVNVGAAGYDSARPPVLSATSVDHIRVSGIRVNYTAGATTVPATNSSQFSPFFFSICNDVVIEDCVVYGAFYMGIVFNACTKFTARRNEVYGVVDRAFYVSTSADHFSIEDNLIDGYQVTTTTFYTFYAVNFLHVLTGGFAFGRVCNNTIKHMAAHGIGLSGRTQDVVVAGNTLQGSTFHGILSQDISSVSPTDLTISGTNVSACLGVGIYVLNSTYVAVTGNTARTSVDGITVQGGSGHVVTGNISRNNTGYGVKLNNSANNLVNSNSTATNAVGIGEIGGASHNVVHDNVSVTDTAAVGAAGVGSDYAGNVVI